MQNKFARPWVELGQNAFGMLGRKLLQSLRLEIGAGRSHRWEAFMARAGAGGVRIRIYFDDLGTLPLYLPDLDEQRKIGDLFATVDREITLLERLLAAYQLQKRGLMQQLLTGKLRVRTPAMAEGP